METRTQASGSLIALHMKKSWLLGLCIAVVGCNSSETSPSSPLPTKNAALKAPLDKWILTCIDSTDSTPALLWNGLIGLRLGRDASSKGQGFFSIDEYDPGTEEKIRTLESPLPYGFLINGKTLPITGGYKQSLDMRTSTLDTEWTSGIYTIQCLAVMDPERKIVGQRWTIAGTNQKDDLDFDMGKLGRMGTIPEFNGSIMVGPSAMSANVRAKQSEGVSHVVEFVLTLARSPNLKAMNRSKGYPFGTYGSQFAPDIVSFDEISKRAKDTWAKRWKTDIEIEGPIEDQQAVHSFLYYLRSSIHPQGLMSVSPFGLSNQMYNGHVFWDADIWVFPSLALIDPKIAKAIPEYRTVPPISGNSVRLKGNLRLVKFPWESSVSGTETIPGPSQKEAHISGDVAWMLNQASSLGLVTDSIANEVRTGVGEYFKNVAKPGKDGQVILPDVMSPDENHIGDNDLYTNLLAQWCVNGGGWTVPSNGTVFQLPKDNQSFLTYDGDPVRSYKQAAAVLSIYPLQYPPAEAEAPKMMERFASKVSQNGPAMSDSVHALIWARIGKVDKAYETWKASWEPFTKQPLLLFSEKRMKPTTYFVTGAAGSLQTVLFGFLGFRLDSNKEPDAAWSIPLQGRNWLSIKANFPHQWKSVKLRNFTVLGRNYTLTATHQPNGQDAAQVTQGD